MECEGFGQEVYGGSVREEVDGPDGEVGGNEAMNSPVYVSIDSMRYPRFPVLVVNGVPGKQVCNRMDFLRSDSWFVSRW